MHELNSCCLPNGCHNSAWLSLLTVSLFTIMEAGSVHGFKAGTQIVGDGGTIKIELLEEGAIVLGHREAKMVVNKTTKQSAAEHILHGFNEDEPFFTGDTVFHTTTGLRAVDPAAAARMKPWLEIGPLRVGHVVLIRKAEDEYDRVVIESITTFRYDSGCICSLQLEDQGATAYFANGYMVSGRPRPMGFQNRLDRMDREKLNQLKERFGSAQLAEMLARQGYHRESTQDE